MITVVCRAILPDGGHDALDLEGVESRWPGSTRNLDTMGANDGTLVITEDWRLLFEFPSGVQLLWHENTRQWETIWDAVKKK